MLKQSQLKRGATVIHENQEWTIVSFSLNNVLIKRGGETKTVTVHNLKQKI